MWLRQAACLLESIENSILVVIDFFGITLYVKRALFQAIIPERAGIETAAHVKDLSRLLALCFKVFEVLLDMDADQLRSGGCVLDVPFILEALKICIELRLEGQSQTVAHLLAIFADEILRHEVIANAFRLGLLGLEVALVSNHGGCFVCKSHPVVGINNLKLLNLLHDPSLFFFRSFKVVKISWMPRNEVCRVFHFN